MNATQERILLVMSRIAAQVEESEDDAIVYSESLDTMLQELHDEDFFGTEGQCDPRGDQRNGPFSMDHVEDFDE